MQSWGPLNEFFNTPTPKPGIKWLQLSDLQRKELINSILTELGKNSRIRCTRALVSGEVFFEIIESILVTERLNFFLDLEFELKRLVDSALYVSCEPLGDKSSLRNLRGIQVKSMKEIQKEKF